MMHRSFPFITPTEAAQRGGFCLLFFLGCIHGAVLFGMFLAFRYALS